MKIILTNGAGLIEQDLIIKLKHRGYSDITVIDKHHSNVNILRKLLPDIKIIDDDLGVNGQWNSAFEGGILL